MVKTADISRLRTDDGGWIGPEELHQLLVEEGYSAGNREQYLKSILTGLSMADASDNAEMRDALMREVRSILDQEQGRQGEEPMSDDV